jgi:hypothetical protein
LIKVNVVGVYVSKTEQGPVPVVLLMDEGGRSLPIFVGISEAISIKTAIDDVKPERPFSHDFILSLLKEFDTNVGKLSIEAQPDGVFTACLTLTDKSGSRNFDVRPSDGIALCLRAKAPIYVSSGAMDKYSVSPEETVK